MENVYQANGYKNRQDYLKQLASEYCLEQDQVNYLASILGPSEDFDGLITSLEDWADGF
jgi:hypothetical protein